MRTVTTNIPARVRTAVTTGVMPEVGMNLTDVASFSMRHSESAVPTVSVVREREPLRPVEQPRPQVEAKTLADPHAEHLADEEDHFDQHGHDDDEQHRDDEHCVLARRSCPRYQPGEKVRRFVADDVVEDDLEWERNQQCEWGGDSAEDQQAEERSATARAVRDQTLVDPPSGMVLPQPPAAHVALVPDMVIAATP